MPILRARGASLAVVFSLLAVGLVVAPPPVEASPGALVSSVTVPVPSGLGVSIAFDGTTFYYTNYGDPTLYGYTLSCAGASCAPTLTLAQPLTRSTGGAVNVDAMAWDGTRGLLWAAGLNDGTVYRIQPSTGVATAAFSTGACNPYGLVDGLAYDGVDDVLWFSSDGSYDLCRYSLAGSLLAVIPVGSIAGFPGGCYNSGLAIGGGDLYMGSNGCGQITRVDKDTLVGGAPFATPGGRDEDMECDPVTFAPTSVIWSKDAYDNTVTAFEIEAGTCGVGGLSPCDAPPLDVAVTRPAAFTRYVDDVASAWGQEKPMVLGDLTVEAASADPARVAAVTWRVDGTLLGPGGAAPSYPALWPASAATPGPHLLTATFHDVEVGCVHVATREVVVPSLDSEALARAVFVSTTHPVETTVRSVGADGEGLGHHQLLDYVEPNLGLHAEALEDTAALRGDGTGGHATSVLSKVSLLGGRIQAELLRAEADAALELATLATTASSGGSLVAGLVVDGTPIPVSAPNTVVAVPGVGRLVLLETLDRDESGHRELRVNALHLYAGVAGFRAEVILGQAVAGASVVDVPFVGGGQEIHDEDDAGTGADVGDTPGDAYDLDLHTGTDLGASVLGGRLSEDDPADHFRLRLVEGEKVVISVKPAEVVEATTGVATVPPTLAIATVDRADTQTDLSLELRAPDGTLVLVSDAPLTAPERIELNADRDGEWTFAVLGDEPTNYTLAVAVTPVAFAPDAATGTGCADPAAPVLAHDRPFVDDMRSGEQRDWFRVRAAIGDDLTATLHPAEPDAADFDLFLYDRNCQILGSSELGKSLLWEGDVPKGVPDVVFALPSLYTGDYWLEVRRIVGVGSYSLLAQSNTLIPTLPANDALTGADASNDLSAPTPLSPNAGVFEGRFEDGDPRDVYSFTVKAGQRASVGYNPSPLNAGTMRVLDPNGFDVPLERGLGFNLGYAAYVLSAPAPADATWGIVLTPNVGGGNYLLSVGQA